VAGAVLSSLATVINLAIVIGAISLGALAAVTLPLLLAGATALAYAAFYTWRSLNHGDVAELPGGRAFNPMIAAVFVLTISLVLLASAFLSDWFGNSGLAIAAAVSGFADTHAAAAAVAAMVAEKGLAANESVVPILLGFSTNSLTKCIIALASGHRAFYLRVIPGVMLMNVAAWLGWLLG
jgi:uncharacterized membrane protein (DUF4010 family)